VILPQESYGSHEELDKKIVETCDRSVADCSVHHRALSNLRCRFRAELDVARSQIDALESEKDSLAAEVALRFVFFTTLFFFLSRFCSVRPLRSIFLFCF
jgi:hypothetical protein